MKNSFLVLFFFISSLFTHAVQGQPGQRCHSIEHQENLYKKYPALKKNSEEFEKRLNQEILKRKNKRLESEDVLTIPVVVHIVHNISNGAVGGLQNPNISDEQVFSQIEALNQDFRKIFGTPGHNIHPVGADTKIEFCLASRNPLGNYTNGIVRVYNNKANYRLSEDALLKSLSYWPSDLYLNIWVADLEGDIIGYAQFPTGSGFVDLGSVPQAAETDGVVIDFKAFGTTGAAKHPYNMGRTATHEIGHWLGLRHIWGDARCGTDYVDDTPTHERANNSCPAFSNCNGTTQDMTENYMDYTPDNCMNLFTAGQTNRMRTVLDISPRRLALRYSFGCCGEGNRINAPILETFESSNFLQEGWETTNEEGDESQWEISFPGAYNESFSSISIDNNSTTIGNIDYLITPFISFDGIPDPILDFDIAYANNNTLGTDTLRLSYNTTCREWVTFAEFTGNELISTTRTTENFIPDANEWKRIRLPIYGFQGKQVTQLRFENRSSGTNRLYIDNINVYKTTPLLTVNFYPVPSDGELSAEVLFKDNQDVTFEIFDSMGRRIVTWTDYDNPSFIRRIDTTPLRDGVYIVKVSAMGEKVVKKIIITR